MQILVLGMHRSGTSAITRLINMMGAWLGDEQDIMPANEHENPEGYWERLAVFRAHDNLLHTLNPRIAVHRNWMYVANFNAECLATVPAVSIDPLRAELAILDAHRPWVVKDPRLCLLLPVWQTLLSEPVYVLMYRHPLEVARSLANRVSEPVPVGFGLVLWEKYVLSTLQALQGKRVLVVSHQRLLAEPWQQCQRLHAYLRTGAPSLQLPSREQVEAFVRPRLHHVRHDTAQDALWLTEQQRAIDAELEHYAAQPGAIALTNTPRSTPDAKLAEYEKFDQTRLKLLEHQHQVQVKNTLIQQQQEQLRANQDLLSQLRQVKADLESALHSANEHLQAEQSLHQRLQESMCAITRDQQQLLQQNAGLREHAGLLNESLAAMRASWSWRLTRPLRLVFAQRRKKD
jgi:hypothetical protein